MILIWRTFEKLQRVRFCCCDDNHLNQWFHTVIFLYYFWFINQMIGSSKIVVERSQLFVYFNVIFSLKYQHFTSEDKMLWYTYLYENRMFKNSIVRTEKCFKSGVGKERSVALIKSLIDVWWRRCAWGAFVKDRFKVDQINKLISIKLFMFICLCLCHMLEEADVP